jgi:two-component system cell cycle sensor histidine kinase/response regulator CckA
VSLYLLRLTNRGQARLAAQLFVGYAFLATWTLFFRNSGGVANSGDVVKGLPLLILSQMFCGLLLDFRANMLLMLGHIAGLAALLLWKGIPILQITEVAVLFCFAVLLSATTSLLHHIDLVEILDSRRQLEKSVEELRAQIDARQKAEEAKSRLEEALIRAQRMESLARLAGGFAHNFNNTLMGILGQLERLQLGASPEQKDRIDDVFGSVERASGLIKGMLSMTHPRDKLVQCQPSDLAQLLQEGGTLARGTIARNVDIEVRTTEGVWVMADQGQVIQILLNLCVNARDALESSQAGIHAPRIRLSMGRTSPQERRDMSLEPSDQDFAWLQVEDNGPGIPPQVRAKIFDPFFTTKGVGKGSGLGLWMCDSVARSMGGQIVLAHGCTEGGGASFRLHLPTCEPSMPVHLPETVADPNAHESKKSRRILLVDDDDDVRDNIAMALHEAGWEVVSAFDGIGATRLFEEAPDDFRLVILDLSLPGMPGREVFRSIRSIRPSIPVLVVSGYDLDTGEASPAVEGANGSLLKPFRTQTLFKEIRRIEAQI